MNDKFSIFFREYQLGIPPIIYNLTHGKPISHSYLALVRGGKTVEEIHGMAFLEKGHGYKILDTSLKSIFSVFSNTIFKESIKLKSVVLSDRETKFVSQSLIEDCPTLAQWDACKEVARQINLTDIPYRLPHGMTCHSVTGTILHKVFNFKPISKFATPAMDMII